MPTLSKAQLIETESPWGAAFDRMYLELRRDRVPILTALGFYAEHDLPPPGLYHRVLREIEYPLLSAALAATRGNQIRAADLLGLNRNTLRKKIRELDIQVYRSGA